MAVVEVSTVAWGAFYLYLLILASILTGGVADQARYGPSNVCLLYVKDYHVSSGDTFSFNATSPACSWVVGFGTITILLTLLLGLTSLFYLLTHQPRSRPVILAFASLATFTTFILFISAAVTSAGIKQTCSELEAPNHGLKCETLFANGFFVDETKKLYGKDLKTVGAA
ncbi:hypothetical protein HK097_010679, partial [Rhizophlyctis rosea]